MDLEHRIGAPPLTDQRFGESGGPASDAPLILVADDVPANVELLFDQLHVLGFRAIPAADGPSALRACFDSKPDLCILDVSMPAGDLGCDDRSTGFEVCRRIKRDPRTKNIPVIFVTALNDTTDRVKAIEAGGDDFLTKPHNRLVLGARVRSLLKLKGATDALEESLRKQRVLNNLVQNAVTHSAQAVKIDFKARKDGDGVMFTVADNGPGIPPQYHDIIFRKFERVKTQNVPRTRSSGLGLAFCKMVVDAHGGRIWVQSAEGQGSSFHFTLPLKPPARVVRVSGLSLGT